MSLDPKKAKEYREETEKAGRAQEDNLKRLLSLADAQRDVLFFSRDYTSEVKKASKALNINSITASETAKAFEDVASAAKGITDSYSDVISGEKTLESIQKSKLKLADATNSLQTEYEQFLQATLGSEEAINDTLAGRIALEDALVDSAEKGLISEDDLQAALDLGNIFAGINAELDAEAENMAEIERRAGNIESALNLGESGIGLGDVADNLGSVLNNLGLGGLEEKLGIKDAVADSRSFASKLTESGDITSGLGDKFKVAKNLAGNLGKNLTKALGPAALLAFAVESLVSAFIQLDKSSGELAKEFGVSAAEGQKLVERANDAAGLSGDLLVSTKDVVAAQQSLNKEFGTAVQFSGKFAAEFASISERTGLSAEAMGMFASNAMITGTTIKDQLADVTEVTMELNNQNGIALSVKEIQEGLGKASASQLLSAGRNTKELANQVYQAKLLGVEQSKVESIADSLLDFEGSIAKELEAELLLGKDLNLEKARQAALDNDLATVAKEITKQVGSAAEFGDMNRIEQEAIAAAVGMTKDELANALVEQEKLASVQEAFGTNIKSMSEAQAEYNRLKEKGLLTEEKQQELAEKGLLNQLESASVAEKFTAVQDKIQDLFMQIASALMPIVNVLIDILEPALNAIFQILNPILDIFMNILMLALTPIMAALKWTANILTAIIEPIMNALNPPIEKLMNAFDNVKAQLGEIFGEASEGVDIFGAISSVIELLIIPSISLITAGVEAVMGGLGGLLDMFSGVADIASGIGDIFSGNFESAFEKIGGGFKKIGAGLIRIILSPIQAGIDLILGAINGIAGFLGFDTGLELDIKGMVEDALGLEEGTDVDALGTEFGTGESESAPPEIGLATGGIVTSPTTALIGEGGEPEAVVPLSRASSLGFGGNEKTVQLLERLVAAVERGGVVELDGNKVGTALGLVSYKTQ